ncbi:hypothetical protein GCM10011514_53200 [Emticicia aquatilis]|uniref:Uncharacterized protein n=1 Tax=Emticicia aquatilis TaxID=1537369 RepID=A0A917DZL7_9BACT|nr:hypothetical protein [Emticicia aquatilis]GGD82481.1 hypothetical protein GCM10011514_53200 [Emticicia aquatilis]
MKTLEKIAIFLHLILVVNITNAQSVLITPQKSKISDTLNVNSFLYIGGGFPIESGSIFQVKPDENAIFYIPNWGLSGTEIITGNFYSPTGNAPQVRFESEGHSFFDIGRKGTLDFVIEYDDDPMLTITNAGQLNVRKRLTFTDAGRSVFIGEDAGKYDDLTENNNVYLGHWAGNANVEGENNVAIGTEAFSGSLGSYNFALDTHALQNNINGNDNIAIGNFAGYASDGSNNILIGSGAGESLIGTRNIIIGRELGSNKTLDNTLWIDVENTEAPLIHGDFAANSLKINGKFSTTNSVGVKIQTPMSTLDVNGSMGLKVKSGLESGTTDPDDSAGIWIYTTAFGPITLPPASSCPNRTYTIVNKTTSSLTISEFQNMLNTTQTTITSSTSVWIVSDGLVWQQIK